MSCPFCGVVALHVRAEIAHMERCHPEVIERRLHDAGMHAEADDHRLRRLRSAVKLSDSHVEAMILAALQNAWKRGCTCGTAARVELLPEDHRDPPRINTGIEHLAECPLWKPIPMEDPEPDPMTTPGRQAAIEAAAKALRYGQDVQDELDADYWLYKAEEAIDAYERVLAELTR